MLHNFLIFLPGFEFVRSSPSVYTLSLFFNMLFFGVSRYNNKYMHKKVETQKTCAVELYIIPQML